jgi:hypothetical protein
MNINKIVLRRYAIDIIFHAFVKSGGTISPFAHYPSLSFRKYNNITTFDRIPHTRIRLTYLKLRMKDGQYYIVIY